MMTTSWALASDNEADCIVTGDKDLLEWPEQRPSVLTPAAFAVLVGV
jgi:predicted nucleic acid-binding protein